eukprot:4859174-Pyramimonas_sp.AAC.1
MLPLATHRRGARAWPSGPVQGGYGGARGLHLRGRSPDRGAVLRSSTMFELKAHACQTGYFPDPVWGDRWPGQRWAGTPRRCPANVAEA